MTIPTLPVLAPQTETPSEPPVPRRGTADMSEKRIVVAHKYIPTTWPITFTFASWLLCDRFAIPGWAWGVYWTLLAIIWIALGVSLFSEESRNPFEGKP